MLRRFLLVLTATLLTLGAAGCGGSDPSASPAEQKVIDNFTTAYSEAAGNTVKKEQVRCFAQDFVTTTGLTALRKAKVITAGDQVEKTPVFTKPLAGAFADAYLKCVDYASVQAKEIAADDSSVDQTKLAACLARTLPKALYRTVIIDSMTQQADTQLKTSLTAKLNSCRTSSTSTN